MRHIGTRSLIGWVSSREAPVHVVRGLREIDPTAELVYLRRGLWLLGSVRWNRDAVRKAQNIWGRACHALVYAIARTKIPNLKVDKRSLLRLEFASLSMVGFRHIARYAFQGEPTNAIVEDFREMDFLYRHVSDNELFQALDDRAEARRMEARAELTDPARGRDAWRYAFTLSHLARNTPASVVPLSSARTRILTLNAHKVAV